MKKTEKSSQPKPVLPTKQAHVLGYAKGFYQVRAEGFAHPLFLRGEFEGHACHIGAYGHVEWREGPGYGLWFFVADPARHWAVVAERTGIVHASYDKYVDARCKAESMATQHEQAFTVQHTTRKL